MDKIEYACNFTTRILDNGSDGEILMLKQVIATQLKALAEKNIAKPNYSTSLEFITNLDKFQSAAKVMSYYCYQTPYLGNVYTLASNIRSRSRYN